MFTERLMFEMNSVGGKGIVDDTLNLLFTKRATISVSIYVII